MSLNRKNVHLILVHYPVLNKNDGIICSSVVNLDIHDFLRLSKSYGLGTFYIVTPLIKQKKFVNEMIDFWNKSSALRYNKDRASVFNDAEVIDSLNDLKSLKLIGTSAKSGDKSETFENVRNFVLNEENEIGIVFGTAFGLTNEVIEGCDVLLEPIDLGSGFNHLSVRSAASIITDRLLI